MKTRAAGFTLIELMVVVAIIAILAKVAIPAYQQYTTKSTRNQAKAVMLGIAQSEERYYTNNYNYYATVNAPPNTDTWPNFAGNSMSARTYDVITTAVTATSAVPASFTITATPSNGFSDAQCNVLSLNNAGTKTNTGTVSSGSSPCWP